MLRLPSHWYYEDFIREANPKLPSMQLRRFSLVFFNSCPLLRKWSSAHEEIFESFMSYKVTVPVCGAILINESWDKVDPSLSRSLCSLTLPIVPPGQGLEILSRMGIS